MGNIGERLASGQRWWLAEIILRAIGLTCLGGAAAIARYLRVLAGADQTPTPAQFLLCLGAVVLLSAGLALAGVGPALFRRMPRPPRALLP